VEVLVTTQLSVQLDFAADWFAFQTRALQGLGYELPTDHKPSDVDALFFDYVGRLIAAKPRTVHLAKDFVVPQQYAQGFAALRAKIERGETLTPHQSRQLSPTKRKRLPPRINRERMKGKDGLFNHWGIHHLHMGLGQDR